MHSTRIWILLPAFAGVLACAKQAPPPVDAAYPGKQVGCFSSPPIEGIVTSYVTGLLGANDAGAVRLKKSAGLMGVSPSEVSVVRDSVMCHRAAVASRELTAVEHRKELVPVILVRAGPRRYFLYDGGRAGEFRVLHIFDSSFRYMHSLAT